MTTAVTQAPRRARKLYGEKLAGVTQDGREFRAGVFNEHEVRAAAGLTMVIGAVGVVYAYFAQYYLPIRIISTFIFIDFLVRVFAGLHRSPTGTIGRWMTSRQTPQWVSARPKRFAWTLGLVMVTPMMIGLNTGLRGALPLTVCMVCLMLMWMEAVLAICLGCELHRLMVRFGWAQADVDYEVCTHGACSIEEPRRQRC